MDGVTGLSPLALRSDVAAFPHPLWLAVLVGSELMGIRSGQSVHHHHARSQLVSASIITTSTNWLFRWADAGRVTERTFPVLPVSSFEDADGNQIRLRYHEAWVPR
jgi:hypothetical protein